MGEVRLMGLYENGALRARPGVYVICRVSLEVSELDRGIREDPYNSVRVYRED